MYFLGIDGGGSQTRALITDQTGTVLGEGQSGPSNPTSVSAAECQSHLEEAIQKSFESFIPDAIEAAHFGIAGARSNESQKILKDIAEQLLDCSKTKLSIGSDLEIALEGGLAGAHGIALIAGTGSACYGKTNEGLEVYSGGWGDYLDDAGSGGWIGLKALQACVRQADGRLPQSELKNKVLESLCVDSMEALKRQFNSGSISRTKRATLAPAIFDLAESGDRAAIEIINLAAAELSQLVESCSHQLKMNQPDIVLLGGLCSRPEFREKITANISIALPQARVHRPKFSAVSGAILIAMRASGMKTSAIPLDKLEKLT